MAAHRRPRRVTFEGLTAGFSFYSNFSMCRSENASFKRDAPGKWSNESLIKLAGPTGRRLIEGLQAVGSITQILLESRELHVWSDLPRDIPHDSPEMLQLLEDITAVLRDVCGLTAADVTPEPQFRLFEVANSE